jgi:hypothetical protein
LRDLSRWASEPKLHGLFKLLPCGSFAVVKGVWIAGFEVYQRSDTFGVSRGYRTQLFSAEGMPHEDGLLQLERVHDGEHIVAKTVGPIAFRGKTGFAEAAPSDAVDVKTRRELRRKIVKYMCRVAPACQQH